MPEVGVLALPYHQFSLHWMTPHHILTRLARYFNVVWLEPAHHWRDLDALRRRRAAITALRPQLPRNFHIHLPEPWLPEVYRPTWARQWLFEARLRSGWRDLDRMACSARVLYLWHHQFGGALAERREDISIYHIEDEYSFAPDPPPMDPSELRVLRGVDQVLVHSPRLMERKGTINPNVALVSNGVDFALYSAPIAEPADIASIPHPRIGYTGYLKKQLNWPLLKELATRHADWSFVFVGANKLPEDSSAILHEISRLPNVHMLGEKTYKDLAAYPQHFDIAIMPYVVNGYTQNIYPLKLHEYLASGCPVVGSPIRSLEDFRDVIALATTVDEWSAALTSAQRPPITSADATQARKAIARRHDWNGRVEFIARTICERLGPDYIARFREICESDPDAAPTT